MMIACIRNWEMLNTVDCRILTFPICEKLHHYFFFFLKMAYDRRSLLSEWTFHSPLMITMCNGYTLCILLRLCFHPFMRSPVGQQDIVMLSDRQIRSCYSILRQRGMKTVWQWSSTCSTVTLRIHQRWLTPSLKQSRNKLDMTSVTPAIITGQDSWPLPVMVHVAIRCNATHWLHAEPRSTTCFIMLYNVADRKGFFSCCKLAGVCFSLQENKNMSCA